ncbi:uncharacterized protein LOC119104865 [Pollicipes pollicipes]|uniref:uncharacterized protein LOC119104865 n=1 Tax=Pollicipes pollicipes TaxID=41117 RepID=UPI001884E601|nr:uncharacterized protein LOC119104865 [Pollicipes pollicipes]
MSTILLQKELRGKGFVPKCDQSRSAAKTCSESCSSVQKEDCTCMRVREKSKALSSTGNMDKCYYLDMAEAFNSGASFAQPLRNMMNVDGGNLCVVYHSTDVPGSGVVAGIKCWQCAIFVFKVIATRLFGSTSTSEKEREEFRLFALGSRCSLLNIEVNSALEEGWYRLCMHHLANADGSVQVAFRGPGTVLMRYFSSVSEFSQFHYAFRNRVVIRWKVEEAKGCDCATGPAAEVQYSTVRQ